MKRIYFTLCFALLKLLTVQGQQTSEAKAREYASTITADDLSKHLHIIASDSMQGRDTGSEGQKMAADYIASQFFDSNLKPVIRSPDGLEGYYQPVELVKKGWGEVYAETGTQRREFLKDFYILGNLNIGQPTQTEVVFAGYGIDSEKYSDYKNLDVKGKSVLVLNGEPKDKSGKSLVTGTNQESEWTSNWKKKVATAREKGASYVFVVFPENQEKFNQYVNQYRHYFSDPKLMLKDKADGMPQDGALFISKAMAAEMFGVSEKTLQKKQQRISRKKKTTSGSLGNATVTLMAASQLTPVDTENVLGLLEGTDKKDEIIVISAHYDHVGVQDGKIYNGADDDGSGTVTIIELAQAFARAKSDGFGPRRSILFMTVTGEEKGLLGSEYYTNYPAFPLANTVANLNIDMVGRIDPAHEGNPNYIYLIGSDKLSSELHTISEEANRKFTNLQLDYKYNDPNDPNRFYYRSDHYNFAKHKIPVIFYFNGTHADYHQPGDDVEKINFTKMEKIGRLIFHTAWEVANRDQRIKVDSFKQ